jgi:hypothetical protein
MVFHEEYFFNWSIPSRRSKTKHVTLEHTHVLPVIKSPGQVAMQDCLDNIAYSLLLLCRAELNFHSNSKMDVPLRALESLTCMPLRIDMGE